MHRVPRRALQVAVGKDFAKGACLGEFGGVCLGDSLSSNQPRLFRVHHESHVAHVCGERHGPCPAIAIRFHQGVGRVGELPTLFAVPHSAQRYSAGLSQGLAERPCEHTGPARAVQEDRDRMATRFAPDWNSTRGPLKPKARPVRRRRLPRFGPGRAAHDRMLRGPPGSLCLRDRARLALRWIATRRCCRGFRRSLRPRWRPGYGGS